MRKNAMQGFRPLDQDRPGGFELAAYEERDGHVLEGVLRHGEDWYPVLDGVPCFLSGELRPDHSAFAARHGLPPVSTGLSSRPVQAQALTNETFSHKWRRFRNYGLDPDHREFLFEWYVRKLGLGSLRELEDFYRGMGTVLEVGPGSGFNARFMAEHCPGQVYAADISEAAFTVFENTRDLDNCHVLQADLMELPFADGSFDFIMADGVLHHTPDTRAAVSALYAKVKPGGRFFFYVYKKMGPVRQFCDAYLRERFSGLEPEECSRQCEGLTELGRELSRLKASVTLREGIPALGIPPGTHDVQRLFYYNVMKCFWNESFDFETNNMVNFDWYHPHSAWQHTEGEVAGWLKELGVARYAFHPANPNGISVLLEKPVAAPVQP